MADLQQRLDSLAPGQRRTLAEKLGLTLTSKLKAYVTLKSGEDSISNADLKEYLKQQLPAHEVPSTVSILTEMPRLPNGKLDRAALATESRPVAEGTPSEQIDEIEGSLLKIWQEILGFEEISIHDDFFEIGGDSLLSIQLVSRAKSAGINLKPADLIEAPSIASLAAKSKVATEPEIAATEPSESEQNAVFPLTPIQRWFFDLDLKNPGHWNQAMSLDIDSEVSHETLLKAIEDLIGRHSQLRTGIKKEHNLWVQSPCEPGTLELLETSEVAANDLLGDFEFNGLPLIRFAEDRTLERVRLVIVAHHLVIDQISWSILLNELSEQIQSLHISGSVTSLPYSSASFKDWAHRIEQISLDAFDQDREFWKADTSSNLGRLPRKCEDPQQATEENAESVAVKLDSERSAKLFRSAGDAYHTKPEDLLLATLAKSMENWTGKSQFRFGMERHGRDLFEETLDVSQTIGWFTSFYPVRLSVPPEEDPGIVIKSIKEQLRQIPNSGASYGILRYFASPEIKNRISSDEDCEEVLFNYLGNLLPETLSGPVQAVKSLTESVRAPENRRPHLLEINCSNRNSVLEMTWTYCSNFHDESTVRQWAEEYLNHLGTLIDHCSQIDSPNFTPSDFPEADMSQEELDSFLEDL